MAALDFNALIQQYQQAQQQANAANEARYQQALGLTDILGTTGRTRIAQQAAQQQASAQQSLISRGLANTTITGAASRGIASDAEMQRQALEESVAGQKIGLMQSKIEQGPDLGMFAGLLQAAASQPQSPTAPISAYSPALSPNAAAGLTAFGEPFKYGGSGSSSGAGGSIGSSNGASGTTPGGAGGPGVGGTPGTVAGATGGGTTFGEQDPYFMSKLFAGGVQILGAEGGPQGTVGMTASTATQEAAKSAGPKVGETRINPTTGKKEVFSPKYAGWSPTWHGM